MAQKLNTQNLSIVTFEGQPVVTTGQLADYYGVDESLVQQNLRRNADRFVEGKHRLTLTNGKLAEFKDYTSKRSLVQIAKNTRHLTLWTRRGAARHAKMLNSDKAWEVFEALEDSYFAPQAAKKDLVAPSKLPPLPPRSVCPLDRQAALEHLIRRLRDHHPTVTYAIALDREDIADELDRLTPAETPKGKTNVRAHLRKLPRKGAA